MLEAPNGKEAARNTFEQIECFVTLTDSRVRAAHVKQSLWIAIARNNDIEGPQSCVMVPFDCP